MKYVILDIDHTICDTPIGLSIEDFQNIDHLNLPVIWEVIDKLGNIRFDYQTVILYLTSRCTSLYFQTNKWIHKNCFSIDTGNSWHLFMRPLGSIDPAHQIKLEYLKGLQIEPKDVIFWLDDDPETILNGRKEGFNVIHPNKFVARGE